MQRRVLLSIALGAASCGAPDLPPAAPSALTDKQAPSLSATAIDGREVRDRRLRGRMVVVTFFSKQCAGCDRWVPDVDRLAREARDVVVVGVAEDAFELDARDQMTTWRLSFPVIHDKGKTLAQSYGVGELPTTVVVDAAGVVRWVGGPSQTEADLRRALDILRDRAQ